VSAWLSVFGQSINQSIIHSVPHQIWSGGQHQLLLGWAATDDVAGLDEDEGMGG